MRTFGLAAFTGLLLWVVRSTFVIVRVRGSSMAPTLRDGDRILAVRHLPIRRNRVVVVHAGPHVRPASVTSDGYLVKRVHAVPGDVVPARDYPALRATPKVPEGCLILRGDNADHSFDSRHAGYFPAAAVRGTAVRVLPRPGSAAKIRGEQGEEK
ncbi:S26 family signal peptidase [Amycolatopsis balhimycina DSM 5908]|uniref:S26 family signal peptidase n=1 Tax=Amycolatopsis balhimycina DSM 5908 TaxID=1081091 RepID=A0A428WQB6_AMYBA|nr:S26 family signal peptidase [Amycolatopsis balhimycina]RSM45239.1 S26 family signal peptidase [Amycolatopsis balhimycina DSM 5908]